MRADSEERDGKIKTLKALRTLGLTDFSFSVTLCYPQCYPQGCG